jgi:non-specific serine/threonine protein kinase/serine/threonine-protein kinase
VKGLLAEALEVSEGQRAAFLARACGDDATLLREVESLLDEQGRDWSFFDRPRAAFEIPPRHAAGERIGPFEILSEIGRGGMGEVYLARRADEEFRQEVALKLIRVDMADADALQRFRTERQISASLEHPNIARLLDGGTTAQGEPYFVMEYVEGRTLLDYCDRRKASLEERLRLFREVCAAIAYAHQNLVVHRDIKPGNILVTADGVPKLLDFGIAKLLVSDGAEAHDQTATQLRALTPDYASPEQVRGQPIMTASDVYSLGVVLYELLTGRRPYHVDSADVSELVRVVCERDPEKPSTAVTSGDLAAGEDATATSRQLRGDLDAIVMKAMRKEPGSRYGSVLQLDDDIRRHLEGLPVIARRGTLSYRAGKFARRHRVLLAAAALVAIALAGGIFATLREARHARLAEARATRRFDDVRKIANSFLFEFHDAIRDLPGSTPARALLVRRALEYLDSLSKESAGDRALTRELAAAYQKVGDVEGNPFQQNLGDLKGALASYNKAIALLEPVVASGSATDEEQSTLANAFLTGGTIQIPAGDPKAAVAMAEKGLALRRSLTERNPGDAGREKDLAQAWQFYAFDLSAAGRMSESHEALRNQAAILRKRLAVEPQDRKLRRSLGQNLFLTGQALQSRGDLDGALKMLHEAALVDEELLQEDSSSVQVRRDLAWARMNIGNLYYDARKDSPAALAQYRLALPLFESMATADPKNTDARVGVGMMHHNIGLARRSTDGPAASLEDFEKARTFYEPVLAADPTNAWVEGMLANLYLDIGSAEEGSASAPGVRPPDEACRSYALSATTFAKLKAAGRLTADRNGTARQAEEARRRCEHPERPDTGG